MGINIHYKSLAWNILKIVGGGAILASVLVAPNMAILLKPLVTKDGKKAHLNIKLGEINRAIKRLRERRLARFDIKGKDTYLVITEYGKANLRKFEFDDMIMQGKPKRWDGKWRLIIFDIPEVKKKERESFRNKLNHLGFHAVQKSVFVYPYDCLDEIDFLANFLDIDRYVLIIETPDLGGADIATRQFFNIPLQT